jgi:hypothetical protein
MAAGAALPIVGLALRDLRIKHKAPPANSNGKKVPAYAGFLLIAIIVVMAFVVICLM